ncbi:MAG: NAD(P)/FAD-dependent oxidoreductase, partial [Daejeonella sp.]
MTDLAKTSGKFPRLVIVGGGFGGIELTKRLKNKDLEVVMLDRHNYHT